MSDVYTTWRITTLADGRYQVDGEITHWSRTVDTREQALRLKGVTRTGWYGQQVSVSLDGAPVLQEGTG